MENVGDKNGYNWVLISKQHLYKGSFIYYDSYISIIKSERQKNFIHIKRINFLKNNFFQLLIIILLIILIFIISVRLL